ncbi:bifunctional diaminohydroxyphosphoribosylaminopyrimidine deaminase/5-amino-6-(5-phosphoribosylamino)uracil reductase RibD [Lujinxingia litoralis]|uniref:Riboflavin biosynthesis protein RibD n=1 Tax=Lujinxingia litoralis TaxID=2211119 RepID=A0A328CDG2_9DELT|nr:bifunctional diaminohydroxyphosphoribosylaminopyrimidine deaminase/5-amino-6-(5-phosphoribosylamino)uracil reductase RibD [Lujinxingia litoralis]RAL24693.1 bifunctional diaminohydroxyphosphoribosylaminopyrimidine deaminase/5-amino-6-(5-phosphoribosylamino)uracil reductase RibD [Lujinxingia litoralis]
MVASVEKPTDAAYMAQAIELARRAEGRTRPNPLVGCVIVRDGEIIGRGYHARAGEDHAEVAAIKDAGGDVAGAELYVNLEPCSHHNRTPPCSDALIAHKIRRVVVGTIDPNPRVSGRGIRRLRAAGLEVVHGVLDQESQALNAPFFKYITTGLPRVVAKWAMTLDGKIAASGGDSRWITGDIARQRVHELRNRLDAILVGTGTLLADDPKLTCRLAGGRDPVRFVLDADLVASPELAIFNLVDSPAPTWVICADDADPARAEALRARHNVDLISVARDDSGRLDARQVLQAIASKELLSVLVEGGAGLHGTLFDQGLIDEVYAFVAPKLIGGSGPSPLGGAGLELMSQAVTLDGLSLEQLGDDLLLRGDIPQERRALLPSIFDEV